ncbi:MAG: PAS-domain containing protein, partial [Acetobacteraceae bacterium]|nr:PAS-domain containing protein [Acetobacteraceae bacterium]
MSLARRAWPAAALVSAGAAMLIALTWFGAFAAILAEQREARAHASADVANQALVFEDQLRRELLVVDQTLRILEAEWESSPTEFDLDAWLHRALVLPDVSLHIFIADAHGIIRASTRPELLGVDVSARDYFRDEAERTHDNERMFIGPSTRGLVTNRWQMNMVRRLDKDGRFAGVIGASYDTGALARFYRQADLGEMGMIALVGASDGKLRALVGPTAVEPGYDISGSAMYQALLADPDGRWIGPSAVDGVSRIHAFRAVADRNLEVIVAFDAASALGASRAFTRSAQFFAGGTSLFILVIAGGVLREIGMARAREQELDADRATLATANAALDAARRQADRKTAQLEATLASMSDGVSMVDGDMKLVAWNEPFATFAGVPHELLKVGTTAEEIVRAQAERGEFGPVDIEAEVARRVSLMRSGQANGTIERLRPGGRAVELRRRAMPGGGFVTLYSDITSRKQAEEAMRRARELAEAATEAKSRFVATVSHEIRTPLNTLLNSLRLLSQTAIPAPGRRLVDMARQAGDGLLALINDILEMSRMEAGQLAVRPTLFALRPLLEGVLGLFRDQAASRQVALALSIGPGVPELVRSDSGRVRQILLNLMSNAVKFAPPGTVRLIAVLSSRHGRRTLRIVVRDPGPTLSHAERARLFQPFSRLDRPQASAAPGSGLGLAISQGLAGLLDAEIGCDAAPGGGNDFWLALPIEAQAGESVLPAARAGCGPLPRSRILIVDDEAPNQIVLA